MRLDFLNDENGMTCHTCKLIEALLVLLALAHLIHHHTFQVVYVPAHNLGDNYEQNAFNVTPKW